MKKYVFGLFLATAFTSSLSAQVTIDENNFPDANFSDAVAAFNTDGDNSLSETEIAAVTKIDVQNKGITDMTGLEHFTALKTLYCQKNKNLTSIDVSQNINLKDFRCNDCGFTSLDVSALENLSVFYCFNNKLTSLDVSGNLLLKDLQCNGNNISSLILPPEQPTARDNKMTYLIISNNPIGSVDVTYFTNLSSLQCNYCNLDELDVTNNKNLTRLYCWNNNLTDLDLSNNTKLSDFRCSYNPFGELDLTKLTSLSHLECRNCELEVLDLTQNLALTYVQCESNHLTTLDLSKNDKCTYVSAKGQTKEVDAIAIDFEGIGVEVLPSTDGSVISKDMFSNVSGPGTNSEELDYKVVEGKHYFVIGKPKADTDLYDKVVTYSFNPQCPGKQNAEMTVTLTTYPYVMYINPLSADLTDGFYSGTIYLDYDAVVPEGTEAYIATGITLSKDEMVKDGEKVVAEQLTMVKVADAGEVIPANTPVYVKSAENPGLFDFARNLDELEPVAVPEGNIFEGTLVAKTVEAKSVLTLGREQEQGTGEIGFWQFTGTKIPAHRVYIDASLMSNENGANGFTLNFEGGSDGISAANTDAAVKTDNAWYSLQGVRMQGVPAVKGVYINNGKKVVVK